MSDLHTPVESSVIAQVSTRPIFATPLYFSPNINFTPKAPFCSGSYSSLCALEKPSGLI
jgi:hypothetical protein